MSGTLMIRELWVKEWAPTAWTDGLHGLSHVGVHVRNKDIISTLYIGVTVGDEDCLESEFHVCFAENIPCWFGVFLGAFGLAADVVLNTWSFGLLNTWSF